MNSKCQKVEQANMNISVYESCKRKKIMEVILLLPLCFVRVYVHEVYAGFVCTTCVQI